MNRILHCDWLPEQARWHYIARLGLPAVSCKKIVFFFHIIDALLTSLFSQEILDIGLVLFFFSSLRTNNIVNTLDKYR